MDHLYREYFGLTQAPFDITPDPFFLYLSASHREALAQLSYGIKARKGFVVLTGEVGTGKTTLIHSLLRDLGDSTQTALIFSTIVNPLDLLRYICEEFHLIEPRQPSTEIHDYLVMLNEFLLQKYRNGENCALIIDEAQNLSPEVLESIRLLSNFETSKDKLLQIVLVGQPELAIRLNSLELRQLKQRITLRYQLRALSLSECREYVSNRLQVAGGDPAIFTQAALESVYRYSGGIPRLINVLGDNALLTSFAMERKHVDDFIIREVAEDLSLSMGRVPPIEVLRTSPSFRLNGSSPKSSETRSVKSIASISSPLKQNPAGTNNISAVSLADGNVSMRLFDALRSELTEAMGPMASIVIEDRVRKLGHSVKAFPEKNWGTLIEYVSQEIMEPSMKQQFQQSLSHRVRGLQPSRKL
jgi:general secretion pathway protein A